MNPTNITLTTFVVRLREYMEENGKSFFFYWVFKGAIGNLPRPDADIRLIGYFIVIQI